MNIYAIKRPFDEVNYDEQAGVVVVAQTEQAAREIAAMRPGDEGTKAWLNPTESECSLIGQSDLGPFLVLRDFRAA